MRLLCASDLHLGRRAVGIPAHLGLDSARFSAAAVWDQLVETALREQVDLVLLAGDVVDRENRLFEALGPLERGLSTLGRHGIAVYAVAGEHDFDTLRHLVGGEGREGGEGALTLLGRDARWEGVTVVREGRPALRLAGWSAPSQTFRGGVLAGFAEVAFDDGQDVPLVAMFHGSITEGNDDTAGFAPVDRAELARHDVALWVAGHAHAPSVAVEGGASPSASVLEPGAACPLRPDETGPHGAWVVEVGTGAEAQPQVQVQARLVALAPVRFEDVSVDLSGVTEGAAVEAALVRALHDALAAALADDPDGHLLCVCCRMTLTGSTRLHGEVPGIVDEVARTLDIQERGVVAAIAAVEIETRPPLDLEPLVRRPDSVGEIARLLAALETDDPGRLSPAQRELVARTVTRLQAVHRARVFATVAGDPEPDIEAAKRHLRRQGWDVLDALIQQRGVE